MSDVFPTPSQTIGPFFRFAMAPLAGTDLGMGESTRISIRGRVLDGAGEAVPDAMVEFYALGEDGRPRPLAYGFGRYLTDNDGRFELVAFKPGTSGDGQAPHFEVTVFARGLLQRLYTRMYFPDEAEANSSDPILSAIEDVEQRSTLVARHADGGLVFDIVLQGDQETVFFAW